MEVLDTRMELDLRSNAHESGRRHAGPELAQQVRSSRAGYVATLSRPRGRLQSIPHKRPPSNRKASSCALPSPIMGSP